MSDSNPILQSGDNERLFTTRQAAAYLGYHYVSVRRLVQQGVLSAVTRAGKTLLFVKSDLDAFRASHARASSGMSTEYLPNPPVSAKADVVIISALSRGRWALHHKCAGICLEDIPKLLTKVHRRFGADSLMKLDVHLKDGARFTLLCSDVGVGKRKRDVWLSG